MDVSVRSHGVFAFGPFTLDAVRRVLSRDGEPIILTPTVLDALIYFVENPGRLVTKDELLDALWPGRFVEEANVRQTVFNLRRGLGPEGERMIATAPGRGYRFTEPVRWQPSEVVDATALPTLTAAEIGFVRRDGRGGDPHQPRRIRRIGLIGLGALALVALVGLGATFIPHLRPAPLSRPARIVLAEIDNQTHDPIFDRTLTGVLRVDLAQSPYLSLLSDREAQTTLDHMGRPKDTAVTPALAQEICARTNSDEVVQGRIAPFGAHYLLFLTAADCANEHRVTEARLELDRREDAIAGVERLADRLRTKLGEPAKSVDRFSVPLIDARSSSLEAVKAYSEGVWLNQHGKTVAALAPLQHAVELDPRFALPRFSLAVIYNNLAQHDHADEAVVAAYALRDQLNERERIKAEVYYTRIHSGITSPRSRRCSGAWRSIPPTGASGRTWPARRTCSATTPPARPPPAAPLR